MDVFTLNRENEIIQRIVGKAVIQRRIKEESASKNSIIEGITRGWS